MRRQWLKRGQEKWRLHWGHSPAQWSIKQRLCRLKEVCWSEPPVIIEKSQLLNKDKYISFPGLESSAPTCRIDSNA